MAAAYGGSPFLNDSGALVLGFYGGLSNGNGITRNYSAGEGVGTYNLNGGLLTGGDPGSSIGWEVIGVAGTGIFNQTGGTNNCPCRFLCRRRAGLILASTANQEGSGYGVYNLSGGVLNNTGSLTSEAIGSPARASSTKPAEPTAPPKLILVEITQGYQTTQIRHLISQYSRHL